MTIEEMREHEWDVPWSGGKDSTATILLMLEHGIPIRQVTHVRMMWDDNLPATLPEMYQFVDEAAEKLRGMGCKVEIVHPKKTAVDLCTTKYRKAKDADRNGKPYGATAFCRGACRLTEAKSKASRAHAGGLRMLGYAADEAARLHRLGEEIQSVLVATGTAEKDCFDICREAGMLSPHYGSSTRDGCWFCPNATKRERKRLREEYPELVKKIEWSIELMDYHIGDLLAQNHWMADYARSHPEDWRWRDSRYAHDKGWIPGQMTI